MIDAKIILESKQQIINNPERLKAEKDVIKFYGGLFNPKNLDRLTKDDFKSFLSITNNKHWEGIHRQSNMITADMPKLIKALKVLLNEDQDLKERLNILFPKNHPNFIKGLGRAIITPILMMVYPKKYGVFNTKSERGLKEMGLLPNFKGKSFSEKYFDVNNILKSLANKYDVTLWKLDEIIGWIALGNPPINEENNEGDNEMDLENPENNADFGLEKHLEDFLIENWDKINLGKQYNILEEDGDLIGQQYPTDIGPIDILAKSKKNDKWLIIELKKGRSNDNVVGQILRYMGWVRKNLAKSNQKVEGVIIVGGKDDRLEYALNEINDKVSLKLYKVAFKLENYK